MTHESEVITASPACGDLRNSSDRRALEEKAAKTEVPSEEALRRHAEVKEMIDPL